MCVETVANKAIVDSKQCHILTNSTKHCSSLTSNWHTTWRTLSKHNVVLDSGPLASWYENLMSSVKLELPKACNVLQRPYTRIEPLLQAACGKIWWSSAMQFSSYMIRQTDKETDILITILCTETAHKGAPRWTHWTHHVRPKEISDKKFLWSQLAQSLF